MTEALGTGRYERGETRRGYRNGHQTRRITTAVGAQTLAIPRGRIVEPNGSSREFRSQALPRYARRTREVEPAAPDGSSPAHLSTAGAAPERAEDC